MELDGEKILEARGIVRRYPGTVALNEVDYSVYRNQVNVLIGENGAGKSTLMRILAGIESPDEGELLLEGSLIRLRSPKDAARHGISIVHQELSVLPNLDLADNVFAGRELVNCGTFLDRRTENRRTDEALTQLRKPMNVRTLAGYLSLGNRQIVEVARTLDQGARILILDEPTSALSNVEADSLFDVIGKLKRSGVTIIYISHRLNELLHLGDQFTVLRSGRIVAEAQRQDVSREWIVRHMSGRDVKAAQARFIASDRVVVLKVETLMLPASCQEDEIQAPLTDISFQLFQGEILGIYGLLGAGRTELLECLAGKRPAVGGKITFNGAAIEISSVTDASKQGIFLVPEDRQRDGLFPELSIRENITLGGRRKRALLDIKEESSRARQIARKLNIRVGDFELPAASLSGGNQQKVLIARCLLRSPVILLLDEPTRGVDVGAKAEIYGILRRLAQEGLSVVFTSSEIEETQALADRALVLCQGRVAAELTHEETTDDALFSAASPSVIESASYRSGSARI